MRFQDCAGMLKFLPLEERVALVDTRTRDVGSMRAAVADTDAESSWFAATVAKAEVAASANTRSRSADVLPFFPLASVH